MSLFQFVNSNALLAKYCEQISDAKAIALDSEFVRIRTFYPHLGLLQVFDGHHCALIDPLSIDEWTPFVGILKDETVVKYFHACSEDIEVFAHHFNFVPAPIFDTQIMASFLDNPLSSGYAALVKKYLDQDLDKSETRTDWLKRPLSEKQCEYAAYDVLCLLPLVDKIKSKLFDKGVLNAAYSECAQMLARKNHPQDPDKAYLSIKNSWQLKPNQLGVLQKLAKWRYNYAQSHDIALNFVVHEEVLFKIVRYQPRSLAELSALGMKGKELRLHGELILSILSEHTDDIEPIKRVVSYPDYKKWATLIKQSAEKISKETDLSTELLVSKRHIEQFVRWKHGEIDTVPELLSYWRGDLFKSYLN